MANSLQIRPATSDDVALILDFIKQLAVYEKLAHEVTATEELLRANLFGEKAYAEVVLAYLDNEPVGFALFFQNFSTFLGKPGIYLEDLFVNPKARGKGIGKRLLAYLAHLAKQRHCGRLEWWVLDWNEEAIGFYQRIGAIPMDDWTVYRVTDVALDKLAAEWQK